MMHAIQHRSGQSATARQTPSPLSAARRTLWIAAWLSLPAIALLATGCGGGSDKKPKQSTATAQNDSQDEEKDAPAAAPPPRKKQKAVAAKPAEPEAPAASTTDVTKWKGDDLNAALLRKDVGFIGAVVYYSAAKPNDAKRAEELDSLAKKVARLKDDPVPEVPIPAGAFAAADPDPLDDTAKPGTTAAAAPAGKGPGGRMGGPFRMGGGGRASRGGDGGK
jgi:hypothetical protein